jgi:hypothetical protein
MVKLVTDGGKVVLGTDCPMVVIIGAIVALVTTGGTVTAPADTIAATCFVSAAVCGAIGAGVGDGRPGRSVTAFLKRHTPPEGLNTAIPVSVTPLCLSMLPNEASEKRRYVSIKR